MPKYRTVAIDSVGELARLFFSKDMGKFPNDLEKIRAINNYAPVTERLNMLIRRFKNLRPQGTHVVFIAHEQIEKVYAKGGMIAQRGQAPQEPIAIKGMPDLPGSKTPEEFCRAADNVLHVRRVNNAPAWVAKREPIGGGGDYWEVKTRFDPAKLSSTGFLPPSIVQIYELAKKANLSLEEAYIWIIYGTYGITKTRSLLECPRPIKVYDLDQGTSVIKQEVETLRAAGETFEIKNDINVEDSSHYEKFISDLETCF